MISTINISKHGNVRRWLVNKALKELHAWMGCSDDQRRGGQPASMKGSCRAKCSERRRAPSSSDYHWRRDVSCGAAAVSMAAPNAACRGVVLVQMGHPQSPWPIACSAPPAELLATGPDRVATRPNGKSRMLSFATGALELARNDPLLAAGGRPLPARRAGAIWCMTAGCRHGCRQR